MLRNILDTERWRSMTPLGCPVEPEVKRILARSRSVTAAGTKGPKASPSAETGTQSIPSGRMDRVSPSHSTWEMRAVWAMWRSRCSEKEASRGT